MTATTTDIEPVLAEDTLRSALSTRYAAAPAERARRVA